MAPSSSLGVSVLQMTSLADPQKNLETIVNAFEQAEGQCLFLPENSLFFNTETTPILPSQAFRGDSPEILRLKKMCFAKKKALHLGGIPWLKDGDVYNQAVIIDEKGKLHEHYAKTHLFDLSLGALKIKESDSFKAGSHLKTWQLGGWTLATLICYDLRFPELFTQLRAEKKVDIFVVPAAFTALTGAAHWLPLLRARAIENQCFVIAPAQLGGHWSENRQNQKKTWGQSLVISPWGRVLAEGLTYEKMGDSSPEDFAPITCTLDYDALLTVRKAMPMEDHRRFATSLELKCRSENGSLPS